jgi:pimeloyl-ACP methyl ester carboxylesterase
VSARRSPPAKGTILYVHGLWMTGAESFVLRRRMAARGWRLRVFRYSSLAESMDRVASRCARMAKELAAGTSQPVHLVGHSLGGLVIYRMFETGLLEPQAFCGDFCRVVFIGTPARGSAAARALAKHGLTRRLLGHAGERDLIRGLPSEWRFPPQLGIIAGSGGHGLGMLVARLPRPHDGTVSVAETHLEGVADRCVLPVDHVAMCLSADVAEHVAFFLDNGRFPPSRPD